MAYLDNAATTFPKPQRVADALCKWIETGAGSPGRGRYAFARKSADAVSRVRASVAEFIGLRDASRLIFCYSATDALNLALVPPQTEMDFYAA